MTHCTNTDCPKNESLDWCYRTTPPGKNDEIKRFEPSQDDEDGFECEGLLPIED